MAARTVREIADEFWARVDRTTTPDGCWPWTGPPDIYGYGQVNYPGISSHPLKPHRVAWELTYGPIPDGKHVLHSCDNPICARPDHLFLGDQAANNADRQAKGRTPAGDRHYKVKLTDTQIEAMRAEYDANPGYGKKAALARKYGISQPHGSRLLNGIRRKEVTVSKTKSTEI
jgi:hypothetical protein